MKERTSETSPRFPWTALERPLTKAKRASLVRSLGGLLRWQQTLRRWPTIIGAPDATPFVSLYSGGRLCGCFGSEEGDPGERIARAFLRALEDARHGGVHRSDREALSVQVSYARSVLRVGSVEEGLARVEPGTHGVALIRADAPPVILVPSVARDGGTTARALFDALARKAQIAPEELARGALFTFEADEVVARSGSSEMPARSARTSLAVEWMSRLVGEDGFVHFGVDPRARSVHKAGIMHHGRAAVLVRALAEHGAYGQDAGRARDWLERDVKAALRGRAVEAWPPSREMVAGTIALACMAGLSLTNELERFVGGDALEGSPWHAAQVVAVLGESASAKLWETCVTSLATRPWAPWTVIAARARGDFQTMERGASTLEASIRSSSPHEGGTTRSDVPELALTALTVEALAPLRRRSARMAIDRGRRFLERWQFVPGNIPASLDPDLAEGSFPLSPVHPFSRGDVTGHAVLALGTVLR